MGYTIKIDKERTKAHVPVFHTRHCGDLLIPDTYLFPAEINCVSTPRLYICTVSICTKHSLMERKQSVDFIVK